MCCRAPRSFNFPNKVVDGISTLREISRIVRLVHGGIERIFSPTAWVETPRLPRLPFRWRRRFIPSGFRTGCRNYFSIRSTDSCKIPNSSTVFGIMPFRTRFLPPRRFSTSWPTYSLSGVGSSFLFAPHWLPEGAMVDDVFFGVFRVTLTFLKNCD